MGLPPGQMGNSEVGHMTMGSGRINIQDITRITQAMAAVNSRTTPPSNLRSPLSKTAAERST